ncbi:hypothetical protein [Flavobacterium rhizosphaerae]|uniref:T9SS C-terminal target domain-containing protein n=1 Tax=Flavobacterium rhizosphaerae TaxID=3163298 RepID=A0ABW8YY41_9FLAO
MKKLFLSLLAVAGLYSCQNDDAALASSSFDMQATGADYNDQCTKPRVVVSGNITTNTTWTNDTVWVISGVVRVKNNATLTINAGTYIVEDNTVTTGANGVLVITREGFIDANGEVDAPVVFTSSALLDCDAATVAAPGDFGGVVLLGAAPVNTGLTTNIIEGLNDQPTPSDFYYGGSSTTDDSGSMSYVRIEYAGRILGDPEAGNEINGLTFGGVGSSTNIDHVQVSWGLDDAFEFFGGTVNASHLVAFSNDDDSFDFDNGYVGSITKAIAVANENSTHSTSSGSPDSNGIELDNNATGTSTTVITRPVIRQMSIVGFKNATDASALENGIHVRRLGQINIAQSTVTGYTNGIRYDVNPTLSAKSSLSIHGFTNYAFASTGTYSQFQLIGAGSTQSTAASAPTWGTSPFQPFYNEPSFSLLSGNTGAFATEANWTASWTQF